MCGISGFVSFSPLSEGARYIFQLNEPIKHRGPDDEGYVLFSGGDEYVALGGATTPVDIYNSSLPFAPRAKIFSSDLFKGEVFLGHRRLSIVDLSVCGHQPMSSEDTRYWIVFNGEIYNHLEIRAELELLGEKFISHSDTEVILAAYKKWGKECLHRFNGMFSFIIYDRKLDAIFLARDRFGVKPLYYWISEQGIAFASEIKQFTNLPGWRSVLNSTRAYDFLAWGVTDHTDETLFKGVFQVRGGYACEFTVKQLKDKVIAGGRLPVYKWYALVPKEFLGSYADACDELRKIFTDAVRLRMRSDVAVGSCLSGGLDSSSIVCVANALLREQPGSEHQKTFSACSHYNRFDERKHIDKVIAHTGVVPYYVYPELDNLFELNEKITWHQDEPFASTSIYAQWCVFQLAGEENVKVMLDGQGADEQLAGYHSFISSRLTKLLQKGRLIELVQEIHSLRKIHKYSAWHLGKLILNLITPECFRQELRGKIGKSNSTPSWLNLAKLKVSPADVHVLFGGKTSSIQELSFAQILFTNLPMLLHWEDRNSMAYSVESRVPFMDYRLVEFSLGLPDEYKLSAGITKRVMRDSMVGTLPLEIKDRMDKMGFVTPEELWLRGDGADGFRDKLLESISISKDILNKNALLEMEEIISGSRPFSSQVWRMISFGTWMRKFDVALDEL